MPEPSPEVSAAEPQAKGEGEDEVRADLATRRLQAYAGWFRGELLSTGEMVPAVTRLRWKDGALTGDYSFGHQLDELGTLHDCSEPEPSIVRCEWRDAYGAGALELRFDESTYEFDGSWSPEAEPKLLHPWTGFRIGEGEPGCGESEADTP